ncbi:TIGR04104 family putative zinc finger protein [Gudongella sp. DL1XJH-153]|uniref:TIGR04104 family putative zinc finger protein n=1 Tax=Gudongella sp. DL1XJH-153 TaxID=3409804 RepID=UPI003BB6C511
MKVQKCINCGTQFRYKSIQKSIWSGYKDIICFNCGAIHEFRTIFRISVSVLIILPVFFTRFVNSVTPTILWASLMYFGYLFVVIGVIPYVIRYRLKINNLE